MPGDTPKRRDALLRLLADWEEGRMTPADDGDLEDELYAERLIAYCGDHNTLTPAGHAAARAVKGEAT